MNASLARLLRCPHHTEAGPLQLSSDGKALFCPVDLRAYPISQGIPDFAAESAVWEKEGEYWDHHAPIYDSAREKDGLYRSGIFKAAEAILPQKGEIILDAGCGTGLVINEYSCKEITIVALDVSRRSLEIAQKKLERPGLLFVRASITQLPFAARSFDKTLCANTLQHLPTHHDRAKAIEELARTTKADGRVVICTHTYAWAKQLVGRPQDEWNAPSDSGAVRFLHRFTKRGLLAVLRPSLSLLHLAPLGLLVPKRFRKRKIYFWLEKLFGGKMWSAWASHYWIAVGKPKRAA